MRTFTEKDHHRLIFALATLLVSGIIGTSYSLSLPDGITPITIQPVVTPTPVENKLPESAGLPSNPVVYFSIASITDGDTFKVLIDGKKQTVRLVGINTPETVDPRKSVECFGKEASAALEQLLLNQTVRLEPDSTQSDRDRYGRLLRFAFLPDGTDVGLWLLENGYAQESLYSDVPHRYREKYLQAQQQANEEQRGLWDPEACPTTHDTSYPPKTLLLLVESLTHPTMWLA